MGKMFLTMTHYLQTKKEEKVKDLTTQMPEFLLGIKHF